MGAASDYLENKILDHVFKVAEYTPPTHIYVALCKSTIDDTHTGSTLPGEVTGGAYERTLCDDWAPAAGGQLYNENLVLFPKASADWGTISNIALCDAQTGGNVLTYGRLYDYKQVVTDDQMEFEAGGLVVTIDEELGVAVFVHGRVEATSSAVAALDYVGDEIHAASCSLADVQAAIASADPGDTVRVPAGSATWTSALVSTKGITLMGNGIGSTVITRNFSDAYNGLVSYKPNAAARTADDLFRLTGFTLKCGGGIGVYLYSDSLPVVRRVRVDHNRIENGSRSVYALGFVYGVADNNYLETFGHGMDGEGTGGGRQQWLNLPREYGTADNFFFEDNTLVINGTGVFHAGGHGGRWVARYNTYSGNTGNMSPVFDAHGNQYAGGINGIYGTMITEWYGNEVDLGSYAAGSYFDQRGGWAMFFCNNVKTSYAQLWVREEFYDADFPYPNDFVMKVTNSYYFNNRRNNSVLLSTKIDSDLYQREPDIVNDPPELLENREFWNHNTSYNGTTQIGVYCGSSLPANGTVGDGAWITSQSVSNVTGMVGPNPATPISGTFYKCTAPNVWTPYYTPYTYPHPLRGE